MELGRQAEVHGAVVRSGGSSPYLQAWLTGADTLPASIDNIRYPYAQHPTVYTAVKRKAAAIGQLAVEVWPKDAARDRDRPAEGHWLPELLAMPSDRLLGDQLKEAVVTFLELKGEFFLWHQDIGRGGLGKTQRPRALALLHPESMWPEKDRAGDISAWRWTSNRGSKTLPLEELTFGRYFNPYDEDRGLGPLRAALVEYTGDHAAAVWNRSFIDGSAIPPLLFTSPEKEWPQEDRAAFIDDWHAKFGGVTKKGRAAALPKGVKTEIVKVTQAEMEFLAGRKYSREQVLSIFGVPPAVAGVFDSPAYVSAPREQIKFFWHITLMPLVRYLEAVFTDLVQRYEPDLVVYFKTEPVLADVGAADFKDKVEMATRLMSWGWSPASVNEALGLGMPTAGQPWLEEGYLPYSLVLARDIIEGATFATPGEEEDPPPVDSDEDLEEEPEKAAGPASALLARVGERLETKADERAQRWTGLTARYGDIGRAYNRKLRSWLWGLRTDTLAKVRAQKATRSVVTRAGADDFLWDEKSAQVKLRDISKRAWLQAIERGAAVLAQESGLGIDFDMQAPEVQAFLAEKAMKIVGIEARVREEVRAALAEGIAEGETVEDLAARVRERFDVERSRATTIARTETAQSFNAGRFEQMHQAGIQKHEWLTSRDTRVRDSHERLDKEVVVIGEPFSNGLKYPGDPTGDPAEVINCRCTELAVIEKEAE